MRKLILVLTFSLLLSAQQRMSLNWLVREDIFAGILANDRARLEKGAQTLETVGAFYPEVERIAWRASIEAMRAVWAHEDGHPEDFRRHYAITLTYFDQLRKLGTGPFARLPEIFEGAVYLLIADRLPEKLRAGAWERAYQCYKRLNELEAPRLDKLPLHMKGEVLAGLAVATQRTGRQAELPQALATVQENLPGTVYASTAKKWAADPALAGKLRLGCLTCHEQNTLGPKLEQLHKVN